jgi:hypothetical protein
MINTIGLYSRREQCGKSEVAKALRDLHGFAVVPFARPLKQVVIAFLVELGYTRSEAQAFVYYRKSDIIPEIGVDARHLLRTMGTEWGCDCVHPDVWVQLWKGNPMVRIEASRVVADDTRKVNELAAVRERGGQVWCIRRPGWDTDYVPEHSSEGELDDADFDRVIVNDGTLLDLQEQVCLALG